MIKNYLPIIIFTVIAVSISLTLVIVAYLRSSSKPNEEKNSPYECGFAPLQSVKPKINIHFYLIAILFIVFDLEIAFLFPWAISLKEQSILGFYSMLLFLGILTVGFIYEWKKGALEW